MSWLNKVRLVGCLLFLSLLAANYLEAQQVTAAITGTVTDPAGAAINGATVTARDVERGTVTTVKTNDSGVFNFPRVAIGTYEVRTEASGFEIAVQPPFTLVLNQTARLTFQMKIGKTTETMEVSAEAPQLQTDTTQVSTLIDAKTNDSLPLATRNFIQLTLLSPGALSVDPQSMNTGSNVAEEGGRPYINGNREQANNFLLDGIDNNQSSENLAGFTPSPDAIAEFNVITQNAPAEFGNFNGGIVSATIKSGTNSFHGNVFEFFRNDIFNANKWENGLHKGDPAYFNADGFDSNGVAFTPKVRWNMFGVTFGGPIIKNKLFFFVDYQGGRLDHPSTAGTFGVLTPAQIGGDFSSLLSLSTPVQLYNPCAAGTGVSGNPCQLVPVASRQPFAGNIIPSNMLDPTFAALTTNSLYPKSIASDPTSGFGLASNITGQQYNTDQGDLRLDYNLSQKDHLFARMSKGYQTDPSTNSILLLGDTLNQAWLNNFAFNWDHNFSPSLLNEVRFGLNWVKFTNGAHTFDSSVGQLGNTIGIENGNPGGIDGLPAMSFGGGGITNPGVGSIPTIGSANVVENFASTVTQFDDVLEYTHGRHVIKGGFQMNNYRINVFYSGNGGELGQLLYGTTYSSSLDAGGTPVGGNGVADWALGLPELVGRGTSTGGWHQRDWLYAGFIQDDWRITDSLTLNLGLRYEARTPWTELNDRQVNVNVASGALEYAGNTPVVGVGSNGFSEGLYDSSYGLSAFQPRFGFAYSPRSMDGKFVVRGAFSISSYLEGTGTNLRLTQNPPFTPAQVEANNATTGMPYTSATGFTTAAPPGGDPFQNATMLAWSGTVQPAVAKQWNLTVQQELAKNLTLQLGYVGQATQHLMVPEWLVQGVLNGDGSVTPSAFAGGTNADGTLGPNHFGNVKDTASNGSMNYNALQAVLQQRFNHGLDYQISYTYSKCMTNNDGYYGTWGANTETTPAANYWQNLYDPQADYAQCYWDAKHVISAYATYELPFGKGKQFGGNMNPVLNAVVGNWQIAPIVSWHTGFPIALYGPDNSGTNSPAARPDCNGPVQYIQHTVDGGYQWVSPSAFSAAQPGTFGNCPAQGPVVGPHYTDADISMQKNFPITERYRLQFRADFLNAFNHPNFAHPDNTVGDTTFGLITGTQDARQIQFALKFYF
ncbi:hypothetical protein Acid345_0423 [Candidatus Koribacter versatilis Ellin345]|uniref:TonB-dependent transporter Oar-like beta-barrel domain-containing protein n=1 Tax=Koribacter versatilis (strain Ellin345) TaxID=204669 RepID=Q1IUM2_KORVE|nr:TonB-dependent receptor [Candidatus Koribacter versatilis]ABF39428.1 hypothetical protein Acid345_0423 [Candidatus Koribacter versatilis Ellin345]